MPQPGPVAAKPATERLYSAGPSRINDHTSAHIKCGGVSYVPQAKDFPGRNRLIAGLSESVVVTEAEKRSGTMITVGYALDQGKEIFCIPSRIGDPRGCNLLIQQGAKLVLTVNDIIED